MTTEERVKDRRGEEVTFTREYKYGHRVIEVCEAIHGCITGSGDGMPDDRRAYLTAWLKWRINEAWDPVRDTYDAAVRLLAVGTLELAALSPPATTEGDE